MDIDLYQQHTNSTAIYEDVLTNDLDRLTYAVLGLIGEAGEVANKLKKVHRGDRELDSNFRADIAEELGDVLWYIAQIAERLDISLDTVASMNLAKLMDRKERGVLKGSGDKR